MDPEGMEHIEKMWNLETILDVHSKKVLFALKTWSAQRDEYEAKEVGKKSDVRELKSEIYSLIGFYSVFQGVMFQGVSQLTLSCKYRILPILLSVFASIATIVGVYLKFSDIIGLQKSHQRDKEFLQVLENRISKIKFVGHEFQFNSPAIQVGSLTSNTSNVNGGSTRNPRLNRILPEDVRRFYFDKQLEKAKFIKLIVLLYLTIFSVGFAYAISVIMCHDY